MTDICSMCSAAANKLYDFVAVPGSNLRFRPKRARENFQVALNGHPARIEAEFAQQSLPPSFQGLVERVSPFTEIVTGLIIF